MLFYTGSRRGDGSLYWEVLIGKQVSCQVEALWSHPGRGGSNVPPVREEAMSVFNSAGAGKWCQGKKGPWPKDGVLPRQQYSMGTRKKKHEWPGNHI